MTGPYKIGTLARLTRFSPGLLRAWERRFDLLKPDRGPGRQRLYAKDDLAVVLGVRSLIDQGRSIGEIAQLGRRALIAHGRFENTGPAQFDALPSAGAAAWRQRVIDASLALDSRALSAALDEVFAALAPERAIDEVVEPVAIEIGRLWEKGVCSVASEHLASDQFLDRIRRLLSAVQPPDEAPLCVAACFPDEQHQLGLAILSWHLAHRGVRVAYLGAALPLEDLVRACEVAPPRCVLLTVTRSAIFTRHRSAILEHASHGALGPRVFVGGQGVPEHAVADAGVVTVAGRGSLDEVVGRVLRDVRSARPRPRSRPRAGAGR